MGKPRLCLVYAPGEEVYSFGRYGIEKRPVTEYEIWLADCINPGTHVASSPSKKWAERIGLWLAVSMGLRFMSADLGQRSPVQSEGEKP